MKWADRRYQLFKSPQNFDEIRGQVEVLRSTVLSLIQDVVVLKRMLREKGLWDEIEYKRWRISAMLDDHKQDIITRVRHHSYFPYILSEEDFLCDQLELTDDELRHYKMEAHSLDIEG